MNTSLTFLRSLFIYIFLIIIHLEVSGQGGSISEDLNRFTFHLRTTNIDENKYIDGTPYLYDEFVPGAILSTDSILYKDILLRYNIFNDKMEFISDHYQEPRTIGNSNEVLHFYIEDQVFAYFTFVENNKPKQGFFEVLTSGDSQILIRRTTGFEEYEEARGYTDPKPARFEKRPDKYYLKFDNKMPVEVRLRKRNIIAAFDKRQKEIADFIKEERLSFRKVDDLVIVAEYYNQLVAGSVVK